MVDDNPGTTVNPVACENENPQQGRRSEEDQTGKKENLPRLGVVSKKVDGVLTEEIVSPLDESADSQVDRMADSTMFFGEFESGLTTTDLGDDYLEDDVRDMVVTDMVLEDTTSYLDEESDSFEDLLTTNDLTSGEGDITTSALDPVLSDIAEDIAIAWLK